MTMPGLIMKKVELLRLTYDADEVPEGGSVVLSSHAQPIKRAFEPAGKSFHEAALRFAGVDQEEEGDASDDSKSDDNNASSERQWGESKRKKGAKIADHYALLGLSHLRYLATDDQIKKAYRDAALKHHPDKQAAALQDHEDEAAKEAAREEIDTHFKAIQEAYEVLSDPLRRRTFDSTDEFDDEIPSECTAEEFYKVYSPVFARNGRWSVGQSVPQLGDEKTTFDEVEKFYDFWFTFKSWREFPQEDEFELDQAEGREHKRWMERQNAKLREKAKKEEVSRIRALVENAYKRDPRIMKRREEEKLEKQRKKLAKQASKREKEEEERRALEQERLRKEEEERIRAAEAAESKKAREKEKKALRKEKQRVRAAAAPVLESKQSHGLTVDDVEEICGGADFDRLRRLCEQVENLSSVEKKGGALKRALAEVRGEEVKDEPAGSARTEQTETSDTKSEKPSMNGSAKPQMNGVKGSPKKGGEQAHQAKEESKEKPWTAEETRLLQKALVKFPRGTSSRWEVVGQYVGRTVDEVLKKVKNLQQAKPDDSNSFNSFLDRRKQPANIESPLSTRDEAADSVTLPTAAAKPTANGVAPSESKEAAKPVPEANEAAAAQADAADVWSEGQEVALVKALKAFPKDTAQRWDRIAQSVPGKTKAQCFKRFAQMRESFRAKKGGAAGEVEG